MMTERQLSLFRSRRQRGVRAPAAREFAVQCMLADTLQRWAKPGWRWTHLPMGERRDPITGARLKRMGTQPGWPDLIFIPPADDGKPLAGETAMERLRVSFSYPCPRPHFLELKRARGGRLTDAQSRFAQWCAANGCPHAVVHSYEEAVAVLKGWSVLRSGVKVQ
jgi:hypothetical protein